MLIDPDGVFMTRREIPEMAKISATPNCESLVLAKDGLKELAVPMKPEGKTLKVKVWRSVTSAQIVNADADAWVSQALGRPCHLVRIADASRRKINPAYSEPGDVVSFADGYPVLVASEASLEDLNRRLEKPITIDRFRPNIVLKGCEPFEEDTWKRIRIGDVVLRAAKPDVRCLVTTQDPMTGESLGPEPLRTLATFRRVEGGVIFGMYYIPEKLGRIAVGDSVEVHRA